MDSVDEALIHRETESCKGANTFLTIQCWRSKESHLETDQRKLSKNNRTEISHVEMEAVGRGFL